ncbi:hypothetical protein H8356DRAFT_1299613 [Neocallimastix lanati (nom. inval.)]|nr:hypothetical protein H8356DRAFT_1299613 [Neocallimastix sp. JGI-2020a]
MELLNETLDLLEKYEREIKKEKNTILKNSINTVIQKDDEKEKENKDSNQRESTTESNVTRVNSESVRSSNSIELHSNSDNDSDENDDEEFKSFPDETVVCIQDDNEVVGYDANNYEYISPKKSGRKRFNSLPSSENPFDQRSRSRSNSSLSTPELLVYDSSEYDSSSSYSSFSGNKENKKMISPSFRTSYHIKQVNESLKGNRIFQNNQLMESSEKVLKVMDTNNYLSQMSSSSDFVIPRRSHSLLDDERGNRFRDISNISPSKSSPVPSVEKLNMEVLNISTNSSKENGQSDSSMIIPSPSTPDSTSLSSNDSFIGPMSRSFSVGYSNQSPNIPFSARPISSLYRKHSLGSHDQRLSRASSINNRMSTFENNRSKSMPPNNRNRKPSLSKLGNANKDGGISRIYSTSTPPVIYDDFRKELKQAITSPLSHESSSFINNQYRKSEFITKSDGKSDLPHVYTNHTFNESEINIKEAGYRQGHSMTLPESQFKSMDKSFFELINMINKQNDTRKNVYTSNTSNSTNNSSNVPSNVSNQSGKKVSTEINNGLLTPRSLPSTPELGINKPFNKRKSSIPNIPNHSTLMLKEEPKDVKQHEQEQQVQHSLQNTPSQKFSEKEVIGTLMNLLNQMEDNQNQSQNQNQNKSKPVNTAEVDVLIHEALDNLMKSYFPEGLDKKNSNISEPKFQAPLGNLPNIPRSPIPKNSTIVEKPKIKVNDSLENKLILNEKISKNESEDNNIINQSFTDLKKMKGQEELQKILNNSAPSLHVKSKKEKAKHQQQMKLIQLQQKQEIRVKMIEQQNIQNQLKQQISQNLQQNALIKQKLKQLNESKSKSMATPSYIMINPEFDYKSSVINNVNEKSPYCYDLVTPKVSPASTSISIESINAVSPRPRKDSFNTSFVSPYQSLLSPTNNQKSPLFPIDKVGIPLTDRSKDIKVSLVKSPPAYNKSNVIIPPINVNNARLSPSISFSRVSVMGPKVGVSPTLKVSPNIQSKSFSIDMTDDSIEIGGPKQKKYNRSPSTQSVDISTSEDAKKKRKDRSKKASIFYIPPDNNSKPLTAIVSDVSNVSEISINSNDLNTVTKNNTIINCNTKAKDHKYKNPIYRNSSYNLSADNLILSNENSEKIAPLRKSNSIGSCLTNYGTVDERQNQFKKIDISNSEGETFVERFLNEINASTGFENNIINQKAQEDLAIRREIDMRRRTMNMGNSSFCIGSSTTSPINIKSSNNKNNNNNNIK